MIDQGCRLEPFCLIWRCVSRLLVLLRRGAKEPARPSIMGKTPLSPERLWERLSDAQAKEHLRSVATGMASAGHYRVLSGVEPLSLYVDRLDLASERLEIRPCRAFANTQLFEERKNVVYFYARPEGNLRWASPIQTWLELASDGPREQDAAEELEGLLREGHAEALP